VAIRYLDAEFPPGKHVGDGHGLRAWTPDVSREMAENAMLLALGARQAKAELARRDTAQVADTPVAG